MAVFLVVGSLFSGTWLSVRSEVLENSRAFSESVLVQTAQAQDSLPVALAVDSAVFAESPAVVADDHAAGNDFSFRAENEGILEDSESPVGFVSASEELVSANEAAKSGGRSNPSGNFVVPVRNHVIGGLYAGGTVDFAAACGTPVVAAADGLVVPDENNPDDAGGWNGGYGNFVYLEHSFGSGIFTRYAHLSKLLVNVGDYVKQGQTIGLVGKTGDATGCHLHFEVVGAANPFAKK